MTCGSLPFAGGFSTDQHNANKTQYRRYVTKHNGDHPSALPMNEPEDREPLLYKLLRWRAGFVKCGHFV